MAVRNDITVRWDLDPRLIIIDASSNEITMQDLIDTLRTLEASHEGIDEPFILNASGKESLGGGVTVGLTVELQNAQVYFQERSWQMSSGVATAVNSAGTLLTDASAVFTGLSDLGRGDILYNASTGAMATILQTFSDTTLYTLPLSGSPLRNDWQIGDSYVIYNNDLCATVGGNLVALDGSLNELYPILQSPNVQSTLTSSSSATNQNIDAIQYSSYEGAVHIMSTGSPGTEYPAGTPTNPVNNLADAITIAQEQGFDTFHFMTDWTFPNGTYLSGYVLQGVGQQRTTFTFEAGSLVPNCEIEDAKVTGYIAGVTGFKDSFIQNLSSVGVVPSSQDVIFDNCLFDGSMGLPSNYSGTIKILDSYSNVAGAGTPTFDMGDASANAIVRNFSGGLKIVNATQIDNNISIDLVSGQVQLDPTVTAGNIVIRGVGTLTDDSSGAIVNSIGLMSKNTVASAVSEEIGSEIQYASFSGGVWLDSSNGTAGTAYPIGTALNPVNNMTEARTIAISRGFNTIYVKSNYTFDASANIENFIIIGENPRNTTLTFLTDASTTGVEVTKSTVTGEFDNAATFIGCHLYDIDFVEANIQNCVLFGTIQLSGSGETTIIDCQDGITTGAPPPTINMGGSGRALSIRNYHGDIEITNKTGPESIEINMNSGGNVILGTDVSNGSIRLSGILNLTDLTTGDASVDSSQVIYPEQMQLAAFNGHVRIDVSSNITGSTFPKGTEQYPVNNLADAITIANNRGLTQFKIAAGTLIIVGTDISDYVFVGEREVGSVIYLGPGNTTEGTTFKQCILAGALNGHVFCENVAIDNITNIGSNVFPSVFYNCIFRNGSYVFRNDLTTAQNVHFVDCVSGVPGVGTVEIDASGTTTPIAFRKYTGGLNFKNFTGGNSMSVDMDSGQVKLESTVTDASIILRGVAELTLNDSSTNVYNYLTNKKAYGAEAANRTVPFIFAK